ARRRAEGRAPRVRDRAGAGAARSGHAIADRRDRDRRPGDRTGDGRTARERPVGGPPGDRYLSRQEGEDPEARDFAAIETDGVERRHDRQRGEREGGTRSPPAVPDRPRRRDAGG